MNKTKKDLTAQELDAKLIRSARDIYCCKEIYLGIQKNVPTDADYQKLERILVVEEKDSAIYENAFTQKVHFGLYGLLYNKIRSSLLEYVVIRSVAITQTTRDSIVLDDLINRMKIEEFGNSQKLDEIQANLTSLKSSTDYQQVKKWRDGKFAHLDVFVDLRVLKTSAIVSVAESVVQIYTDLHQLNKDHISDPQSEIENGYAYPFLRQNAESLFSWSDRWKKEGQKP